MDDTLAKCDCSLNGLNFQQVLMLVTRYLTITICYWHSTSVHCIG
jgi:hypothetical protein